MKKPFSAFITALALALAFLIIQFTSGMTLGIYYGVQAAMAGQQPDPTMIQTAILGKALWITLFSYCCILLFSWLLLKIQRVQGRDYISFASGPTQK